MDNTLKEKEWKSFNIVNLFDISGTKTTPLKTLEKKHETTTKYPYITTKADFMGVDGFFNYYTENGNVIVIDSATDGNIHYQENNFSASDHVEKLIPKFKMNKYVGFFIVSSLKYALKDKFNYGYKLSQERIERQRIMLPIDNNGNPDYNFMENYIKQLITKQAEKYIEYIEKMKNKLKYVSLKPLECMKWKSFFINDLFTIKPGKRLTQADMKSGNIPFIGAASINNGITNYVSNTNNSMDNNVLGVNYNGSIVENFYHPYTCLFSDDVKRFHLKHYSDNKHILLFFKVIILNQKEKYLYGYKFNAKRMNQQLILVPVDENENPDYKYMEQYMKNIEIQLLSKYQNFIQDKYLS